MANEVKTVLKTESNKGIPTEFILLFKKFNMFQNSEEYSETSTRIETDCRVADHKRLVDEIIELSTKYPKEVYILNIGYESDIYKTHIYKVALGEISFIRFDILLLQNLKEAIEFPKECVPLINKALKYLGKLDFINEAEEVEFCPFKTSIHIEDEKFKVVVEKHGMLYKVKKVYKKSNAVIWEKYESNPFIPSDNIKEVPF